MGCGFFIVIFSPPKNGGDYREIRAAAIGATEEVVAAVLMLGTCEINSLFWDIFLP